MGEIIIDINFLNHLNHAKQLLSKLFFTQLARIDILSIIDFVKNYQGIIDKLTYQNICHLHWGGSQHYVPHPLTNPHGPFVPLISALCASSTD